MSRNLGTTECHGPVVVEEAPRPITPDEAGVYYDEYRNQRFANAHCPVCGAKYLAWFTSPYSPIGRCYVYTHTEQVIDLSYRRAFNDEPHDDDLPTHIVRETVILEVRPVDGGEWTEHSRKTGGAS